MEKKPYRTEGRQRLLDFLSSNPDRQLTAEEICRAVNGDANNKRSSTYRRLQQLCDAQILCKFRNEELGCSVYQYVGEGCSCRSHFHGKCTGCGQVMHLECDDSVAFADHLLREHGFSIDCGQSMLYGLCAACRAQMGEG